MIIDTSGNITSPKFITSGGNSSQFVKGDGSLDNTNFVIVGKLSLGLILHILLVHFTFSRLEKEAISKKQYDSFFIMIIFFFIVSLVLSYFFDLFYLSNEIQMAMLLIECKLHPDEIRSIWGFHVRSIYVPYVFLMMKASFGGDLISDLIGIAIGYLYYELKYHIKEKYGIEYSKIQKILFCQSSNFVGIVCVYDKLCQF